MRRAYHAPFARRRTAANAWLPRSVQRASQRRQRARRWTPRSLTSSWTTSWPPQTRQAGDSQRSRRRRSSSRGPRASTRSTRARSACSRSRSRARSRALESPQTRVPATAPSTGFRRSVSLFPLLMLFMLFMIRAAPVSPACPARPAGRSRARQAAWSGALRTRPGRRRSRTPRGPGRSLGGQSPDLPNMRRPDDESGHTR